VRLVVSDLACGEAGTWDTVLWRVRYGTVASATPWQRGVKDAGHGESGAFWVAADAPREHQASLVRFKWVWTSLGGIRRLWCATAERTWFRIRANTRRVAGATDRKGGLRPRTERRRSDDAGRAQRKVWSRSTRKGPPATSKQLRAADREASAHTAPPASGERRWVHQPDDRGEAGGDAICRRGSFDDLPGVGRHLRHRRLLPRPFVESQRIFTFAQF